MKKPGFITLDSERAKAKEASIIHQLYQEHFQPEQEIISPKL